jgi:hypothetical protein
MTGNEITLGSIGVSVLLSILLRMLYGTWELPNKVKPWIAVACGMALAVVALLISNQACTGAMIATYLVQGFMTGATATGLYEMTKTAK